MKYHFPNLQKSVNGLPLIEHGAFLNDLAFSADTINSRRMTPTFTVTYPDYGRIPGRYFDYVRPQVEI